MTHTRVAGALVAAGVALGGALAGASPVVDGATAASGTVEVSAQQLLINQRIAQAAIRRVNALQAKVDGVPAPSGGGGAPAKVTLSVDQLVINQRIAQTAIRRVNALTALINGEPAPSTQPGGGDRLTLSATQLLINQRIAQAAIRRVNALAERVPDLPVPRPPSSSLSLDRVAGVAIGPHKMRIIIVQRGSVAVGAVMALVLPPERRQQPPLNPNETVSAFGVAAEGTFYGFYVSIEPAPRD